jgi:hypothetical protein
MSPAREITIAVIISVVVAVGVMLALGIGKTTPQAAGTSPSGSTGQSARQYNAYGVNLATPGANGTSTSILNNSGNDLYVTALKVGCENVGTSKTAYTGAGLTNAGLTVNVGTTSTAAPASVAYTFPVTGSAFALSTSTTNLEVSSSTLLIATSSNAAVWNAGTYMTFFVNATNTATCTFGVDAFSS